MSVNMRFQLGTVVKRRLGGLLCFAWHVGIAVERGQVIHFNGMKLCDPAARLVMTTLDGFAWGKPVMEHCRPCSTDHARNIVKEAKNLLRQRDNGWNDRYSMLTRNCEDFCVHCYERPYNESNSPVAATRLSSRSFFD